MIDLALKMLLDEKARFAATVLGVGFAAALVLVQVGIFFGLRPDRLSEPRSGNRTGRPDHGGLAGRKPLPAIRP